MMADEDDSVTIVIKNINIKYQQEQLMNDILHLGVVRSDELNFFCLPVEPKTGTNRGVAFASVKRSACTALRSKLNGLRLGRYSAEENDEEVTCEYCPTPVELLMKAKPSQKSHKGLGDLDKVMFCSDCDAIRPNMNAIFCPECGQRFDVSMTPETSPPMSYQSSALSSPSMSVVWNVEDNTFNLDKFESWSPREPPGHSAKSGEEVREADTEDFSDIDSIRRLMSALYCDEMAAELNPNA